MNAFGIFEDKVKSISLCISRFDAETRDSFLDLYTKVDSGVSVDEIMADQHATDEDNVDEEDDEENDYS